MRPTVFGVTGKARSGKDTVANFIVAAIGGYRYAFADPIRAMLRAGFGIDMSDPYWQERKEVPIAAFGKSPRQIMQTLGTEWGRDLVHTDIWVLMAQQKLLNNGAGMVISDVRFENEARWVRKLGGVVIHVVRSDNAEVNPHASEGGVTLADTDKLVTNAGSLEELQEQVKKAVGVA